MKTADHRILNALFLLGLLNAACVLSILTSPPTEAPKPPSETPTNTPVPPDTPTATTVSQAFFCVWSATPTPVSPQCTLPTGEERSEFCVSKVPYTLIAIPNEFTYKVLTPGILCTDAGVKNNSQLLTCTGPQSYSFAFQICNSACVVATATAVPAPTGLCPQGFDYLPENNCCSSISGNQSGCATMKFNLRSCGQVNCYKIKNVATCNATPGCGWVPGNGTVKSACLTK